VGYARAATFNGVSGDPWKQVKGKIQQQWGKLTDDDLDVIEGKAEELVGRVQERYGIAREEAEKQVAKFRSTR
jgi:uncharacterized protein YjbJ (UPF0337 family)